MNAKKATTQHSMNTESEPPRRKLASKKDTLKDLSAPARVARHVQRGRLRAAAASSEALPAAASPRANQGMAGSFDEQDQTAGRA